MTGGKAELDGKLITRGDRKAVLLLLLYSFVLLFFISTDSYLYDLYYHLDTPAFYVAGKAWMCGMLPYSDFADSKGPLLWLIYGIGYLLSHHSYVGVFWLSVPIFTVTLFAAYKLCRLYVDKNVSAVATAALPFFLLCFHYEMKAECFCSPFVMLALYCACRILKVRDSDAHTYFKLSALMGVCSMCCVLIKYNVGCMIMGLMAVVLYMAARHKAGWQSLAGMAVGFVAPAVPFIICFLICGNMDAFVHEYFLNTFETMENKGGSFPYKMLPFLVPDFIGLLYFSKKYDTGYWLVPCALLFLVGAGGQAGGYYFRPLLCFYIFFFIALFDFILYKFLALKKHVPALCVAMGIVTLGTNIYVFFARYYYKNNEEVRASYYQAAYVMSQIKDAKVMYGGCDTGIGVAAGTLPAGRYWIGQTGLTEEMRTRREKDLKERIPDFVCVGSNDEKMGKEIEGCGYIFYCYAPMYYIVGHESIAVYGRPGLRLPPEDFHVSQWDVWLKRNIFGI